MDKDINKFSAGKFTPFSFRDLELTVDNISKYSTLQAEKKHAEKKRITKTGVFTGSFWMFIKTYIKNKPNEKGIKRIIFSFSQSMISFLTNLKLLKLQGRF
jgi:hypothetical protein